MVNYKAQVLRGEKWFHLMTEEELLNEPKDSSKPGDVAIYKESCAKVVEEKKESKKKGEK